MNCLNIRVGFRQPHLTYKVVSQPRLAPRVSRLSSVQVFAGRANKKKWRKWRESAKQWLYSKDFTKEERAILHHKGITIEMIYNFMQMGYTKDEIFQFGQHVKVERKFHRPWQEYLKDFYDYTHDEIKTMENYLDKRGLSKQVNKDWFKKKVKMIKEFMKMDQPQVQQFISKNKDVLRLPEQQLTSRLQRVQDWSLLPFWRRDIRRWPGILNYDTRWIQQRIAFICEALQLDENLALDMWAKEPKLLEFRQNSIYQLIQVIKQENMDLDTIQKIFMQNPSALKNSKTSLQTRLQILNNSGISTQEIRQILQKDASVLSVDFLDAKTQLTVAFFDKLLQYRFGSALKNNPQLFSYDLRSHIAPRIYFLKRRGQPVTNLKVILYWPDIEFCLQVAACELYEYHQFLSQEWYPIQWQEIEPILQKWRKEVQSEFRELIKMHIMAEEEEELVQMGIQQEEEFNIDEEDSNIQEQNSSQFQISEDGEDRNIQIDGDSDQIGEEKNFQGGVDSEFQAGEEFVDDIEDDSDFLINDDVEFQSEDNFTDLQTIQQKTHKGQSLIY
eukprot:TRINITY_DN26215_c0_g3_i1.p1 TRINITY_DN26215_c0_g3~~TRINITY_DN26215_c0_g3_i1.p1  ORF type:complete len:573 (-),score=58.61 TRINITY_DN26215_c0_g3_i1:267-1937(-)